MPKTMLAVVKPEAAPGVDVREVKIPGFGRADVLVKVKLPPSAAPICTFTNGTGRPRAGFIPHWFRGHEFCGEVVACGDEVTSVRQDDFVSTEMYAV